MPVDAASVIPLADAPHRSKTPELYRELGALPAGLGTRALSGLVDVALLALVAAIDFLAFGVTVFGRTPLATYTDGGLMTTPTDRVDPTDVALVIAPVALFWLWNRVVRVSRGGASVGMNALGIRLVAVRTGTSPSADMALIRELLGLLLLVPAGIGLLSARFDPERRSWADRASDVAMIEPPL